MYGQYGRREVNYRDFVDLLCPPFLTILIIIVLLLLDRFSWHLWCRCMPGCTLLLFCVSSNCPIINHGSYYILVYIQRKMIRAQPHLCSSSLCGFAGIILNMPVPWKFTVQDYSQIFDFLWFGQISFPSNWILFKFYRHCFQVNGTTAVLSELIRSLTVLHHFSVLWNLLWIISQKVSSCLPRAIMTMSSAFPM